MINITDRRFILFLLILLIAVAFPASWAGCAVRIHTPATTSGDFSSTIAYKGIKRTYIAHISSLYHEGDPAPLVIVLHGGGGTGQGMIEHTGFNSIADRENFIVVYPDGYEKHWNDGRGVQWQAHVENMDDVGFISAIIDEIAGEYDIDLKRIYVTGISNGGMMSHRLACELSNRIAAIAPVASNIPKVKSTVWEPSQPVSVLIINGTEDPLERWEGGEIQLGRKTYGVVLSVAETVKFWTGTNQCNKEPFITHLPDNDPYDKTTVTVSVYKDCKNSVEVVLYTVEGGGHTWPGGIQYLPQSVVGRTCRDFNASEVIWQFFKDHPME